MLEFDLQVNQERREQSEPKSELDLELDWNENWLVGLETDWKLGEQDAIAGKPSRNLNFVYNAGFCHGTFSSSNLQEF